jgi:rhodanese-related sulfurtransferase
MVGCTPGKTENDVLNAQIKLPQFRALVEESKGAPSRILIADARTPDEFAAGAVPGSRNVRAESARPDSPELLSLSKFETIVVYGADPRGPSARALVKRLLESTPSRVLWYGGGVREWRAFKLPLVDKDGKTVAETPPAAPTDEGSEGAPETPAR